MIVGTAGHIDHGKTSLVRALTGVDTDRLKEEKARGISIELGYAYRPVAEGVILGFVDVPGHERFIPTMLAGATGIDFALLVVAADDGVMPQTREHLEILDLLGIERAAAAITKIDRVDARRLEEVKQELGHLLAGTKLAGAPCFAVSSLTGAGLDTLQRHLNGVATAWQPRRREEYFRLAVDRSFTLAGVGTVVTGTVFAGTIRVGDELLVTPSGMAARVRGLHVHNEPAAEGSRGQRCAAALAGIARTEVQRGDWLVSPFLHAPTTRFDARMRLLARAERSLTDGTAVHVHLGAAHRTGRIAVLQGSAIAPGAAGLIQIVVDRPLHCAFGDICVLRDAAATRTLGGGPVIDPWGPARHRRGAERIAMLEVMSRIDDDAALTGLADAARDGVDAEEFARCRNRTSATLSPPQGCVTVGTRIFSTPAWQNNLQALLAGVAGFHARVPDEPGLNKERLRRMLFPRHDIALVAALADALLEQGRLARHGPWLHLPEHNARLSPADEALAQKIRMHGSRFDEPVWVRELATTLGHDEQEVRQLMLRLMRRGEFLAVVRDLYLTPVLAERYAEVVARLEREEGAAPAGRFRDETGLGRKRAIQVLEFFDRIGYTRMAKGVHRVRGEFGQQMFSASQ